VVDKSRAVDDMNDTIDSYLSHWLWHQLGNWHHKYMTKPERLW